MGKELIFPEPIPLTAAQVARVQVKNLSNKSKDFYVTISGYERDV